MRNLPRLFVYTKIIRNTIKQQMLLFQIRKSFSPNWASIVVNMSKNQIHFKKSNILGALRAKPDMQDGQKSHKFLAETRYIIFLSHAIRHIAVSKF
jgi:hypothetical protein